MNENKIDDDGFIDMCDHDWTSDGVGRGDVSYAHVRCELCGYSLNLALPPRGRISEGDPSARPADAVNAELRSVMTQVARDLYRIEVRRQGIGWDDHYAEVVIRSQHALAQALNSSTLYGTYATEQVELLRAAMAYAAEVIGAQTFDLKNLAKCRRSVLVSLADDLLSLAEGRTPASNITRRPPGAVRRRFPELVQS